MREKPSGAGFRLRKLGRRATGHLRALPEFLVIGAQRCGTTSFCDALFDHPALERAFKKGIHYFDLNFTQGQRWYRSHFPLRSSHARSGEASAYYLFHPGAPSRTHGLLPQAKLIALLRNPIHRAHSHYQYEVRRGRETLSFEEALDREEERLLGEEEKLSADPGYRSYAHRRYSYQARGLYARQIERWLAYYPREQLLILRSEDLYEDPDPVMAQVTDYLGLPEWKPGTFPKANAGEYADLDPHVVARLTEVFAAENQRLAELTGRDFGWNL